MNIRFSLAFATLALAAIGCSDDRVSVPDASGLSLHCREGEFMNITNHFEITDAGKRKRFVKALRGLDWSKAHALENVRLIMPDFDVVVTDADGGRHVYQSYWKIDALLDQGTTRMLEGDVSELRRLVAAESNGAQMWIDVMDRKDPEKWNRTHVSDAKERVKTLDALKAMRIDQKGISMASAGDMRAMDVIMSFVDRAGERRGVSFYWGEEDAGVMVQKSRLHDVHVGLNKLRALVTTVTSNRP